MKRAEKVWLVLAIVFILAGALLFAGVMTRLGWDFEKLGTERPEARSFVISEEFRDLSVRCGTADVRLVPSGDGSCRIYFEDSEKTEIFVTVEDGALTIRTADTRKWYEHIGIFIGRARLTLYLPKGAYGALQIEGSTGDVTVPSDFSFDSLTVDLSTGDAELGASVTGPAEIRTDTGDIRAADLAAGSLALSVTTGAVDVRSVSCGDLSVTVTTGKAALTDVACASLTTSGSTGDVTLKNVKAAGPLSVERSTGDVVFDACDAEELTVKTGTGDVTGTLLTGKAFDASSSTGRIEVPESVSGGVCRISTSTGDIRISVP